MGHCKHFPAAVPAAYVGPHGSIAQQVILHSMGGREPTANWPIRGLTWHLIQATVGRLEPAGRGSSLKGWAAASISREPSQLPI